MSIYFALVHSISSKKGEICQHKSSTGMKQVDLTGSHSLILKLFLSTTKWKGTNSTFINSLQ